MKHSEQYKILEDIVSLKDNNELPSPSKLIKELPKVFHIVVTNDWKHYTILEKTVFLTIWSPLLWFLPTLLMKI